MSTRSKIKSEKKTEAKPELKRKPQDARVMLIHDDLVKPSENVVEVFSLRNPSTEKVSKYMHSDKTGKLYELLCFNEEPRCWFANEMVYADGKLYMTSPIDPLFFGLYYIRLNNAERCQPIDQTIVDDNFEKTHLILELLSTEQLSLIADQKGDPSLKAFKYNEEKTLKWLSLKCKKLANAMKAKNFHVGAKSVNYVKSEKLNDGQSSAVDSELLAYAFGILGEYITVDLSEKLADKLGLERAIAIVAGKRKSSLGLEHKSLKRIKSEEDLSIANIEPSITPQAAKEKKVSAKEKQMARAASGTKSISSFFTKK